MKIGELAKKTGCKVVTIRYYEKEGLLRAPERNSGNYRLYGQEDLDRLEFIRHCRRHGMQLGDIKNLLTLRDHPERDCTWVSDLLGSHIDNVQAQIHSLEHLKSHLEALRSRCSGGHSGATCGIMQGLDNKDLCCAACGCQPPESAVRKQ